MSSLSVPALKAKSSSLPVLSKRKLRQQTQNSPQGEQHQQLLHLHVPDRLEEQLPFKIKLLAERSMKKLEEKYDTIDRWKQRYIAQAEAQLAASSVRSRKSSRKLPVLNSCVSPCIPEQAELGKKLQAGLKERVERNKRYYEHKRNIVEKEINYFQEGGQLIPIDKKRELELKKLLIRADKDRTRNNNNGFMYQQIKLTQHPDKKEKWQVHLISQQRKVEKKEEQEQWKRWSPDFGSGLQELKRRWMQEAIQSTPQGWNLKQEVTQQIEQAESNFSL